MRETSSTEDGYPGGQIAGVWAPVCTPLDEEGSVDASRLIRHANHVLEAGCHGVVLFGTTGEATSFSVSERMAALEALAAAGLGSGEVVVGTGCASPVETARLTGHAVDLGYEKVLMLPPFYYRDPGAEGLFRAYAMVADLVGSEAIRVYLYHIPQLSGAPISVPLVARLIDEYGSVIAGLKDSSGNAGSTEQFIRMFPGLAILPGNETAMLALLRLGARGCISATANVWGGYLRELYDLWQRDDPSADAVQEAVTARRRVIDRFDRISPLKYLIAIENGDPAWRRVRPPLVEIDDDTGRRLQAELAAASA